MALLLCSKLAEKPFYYEKLDIRLWSLQELCYVLYRYPVLIPEDFVDQKLLKWIAGELDMPTFAERLGLLKKSGAEQESLILRIQKEGNYYTERELSRYQAELRHLKEMDSGRFAELLGDTLFAMGRYGKAVTAYRESAAAKKDPNVTLKLGDAYVTVMQLRKAAAAYEAAYEELKTSEALKKLYYLSRLDPSIDSISGYAELLDPALTEEWEKSYQAALAESGESAGVARIEKIYQEGGEEFRTAAREQICKWKRAYRAML